MATVVKSAKDYIKKQNEAVIWAGEVEKYHESKDGHSPRVLVIGESQLAYFKGKSTAEFNRNYYWIDLTKCTLDGKTNTVTLTFRPRKDSQKPVGQCKFSTKEVKDVLTKCANYLVRVLPPTQIESTGIKELSDNGKGPHPTATLNRLHDYSVSRKIDVDSELQNQLTELVRRRTSQVVVPHPQSVEEKQVKAAGQQQMVLAAALQMDPFVEEVIFNPPEVLDPFDSYASLPGRYAPWPHVTFVGKYTKELPRVFSTIADNPDDYSARGYSFINTQLGEKEIIELAGKFEKGVVPPEPEPEDDKEEKPATKAASPKKKSTKPPKKIAKPVESWCFSNAVTQEGAAELFENLLTPAMLEDVKVLTVNQLPQVNYTQIITNAKNLVALSLGYNDFELANVLPILLSANLPGLKALSLAGNKCNDQVPDLNIPEQLELLDLSNCTFADGQLSNLLRKVLNGKYEKGITLYLSGIKCSNEELVNALNVLSTVRKCPLVGLGWSTNAVPVQFEELLKSARQLRELYLNDCLAADNEASIEMLARALPACERLRKVSLRGGEKKLGTKIVPIVNALKNVKTLEWLDISEQNVEAEGLEALIDLVNTLNLKFLCFDGSHPQTAEPIEKVFTTAQEKGVPITISYPLQDATALSMEANKLIALQTVLQGNQPEPYDEKDKFTYPFDFYLHECYLEERFPTFMSRHFVQQLAEATELEDLPEIKTPKKEKTTSSSSSESYTDDVERVRKQNERRKFYEEVSSLTSTSEANKENAEEEKKLKPLFTEDGYVEPDWEAFSDEVLVTFDNTTALNKLNKKYSLAVLREAIQ